LENNGLLGLASLLTLVIIFLNVLATRDIYRWVPTFKKQCGLWILVWCLPGLGLFLANKFGAMLWFTPRSDTTDSSTIAGGFMEADSVLNPGMKHRIELMEKQQAEIRHESAQPCDENDSRPL
jgi:hypothetical protein